MQEQGELKIILQEQLQKTAHPGKWRDSFSRFRAVLQFFFIKRQQQQINYVETSRNGAIFTGASTTYVDISCMTKAGKLHNFRRLNEQKIVIHQFESFKFLFRPRN